MPPLTKYAYNRKQDLPSAPFCRAKERERERETRIQQFPSPKHRVNRKIKGLLSRTTAAIADYTESRKRTHSDFPNPFPGTIGHGKYEGGEIAASACGVNKQMGK